MESFGKKAYFLIAILLFVPVLVIVLGYPALAERDIAVLLCTAMHFKSAPVRILTICELCGRNILKSATVVFPFHIYIYIYVYICHQS
jgi:hypothetical protein